MASTKTTALILAILCLVLIQELEMLSVEAIDCNGKCKYRCSQSSRQKMCLRACKTCCRRCKCVPPGHFGHENVCPCYANMTTHGGRHKCP